MVDLNALIPEDSSLELTDPLTISDSGGLPGFYNLLEAISDPAHEQHEELRDWLGGEFDPEGQRFRPAESEWSARRRWPKC